MAYNRLLLNDVINSRCPLLPTPRRISHQERQWGEYLTPSAGMAGSLQCTLTICLVCHWPVEIFLKEKEKLNFQMNKYTVTALPPNFVKVTGLVSALLCLRCSFFNSCSAFCKLPIGCMFLIFRLRCMFENVVNHTAK